MVESFERFIAEHKDEITALQILYNRPQRLQGNAAAEPLTFEALKALADTLQAPPHLWTEGQLWQSYAALDKSKVKEGERGRRRILTDLVSLVRLRCTRTTNWCRTRNASTLIPRHGCAQQAQNGAAFTTEQMHWLHMIREHIAGNLTIVPDDFEYSPFAQEGGMGKVYQLFGSQLPTVLEALNRELAA